MSVWILVMLLGGNEVFIGAFDTATNCAHAVRFLKATHKLECRPAKVYSDLRTPAERSKER